MNTENIRTIPISPPVVTCKNRCWAFDQMAGKITFLIPKKKSPFHILLVYQMFKSKSYRILYKSGYVKVIGRSIVIRLLYNQFMFFFQETEGNITHPLFDVTKGITTGELVIPKTDSCRTQKSYNLELWHGGQLFVHCTRTGRYTVTGTMYAIAESNKTDAFKLFLVNGVRVDMKRSTHNLIVNSQGISIINAYYREKIIYFMFYPRANRYRSPILHRIADVTKFMECKLLSARFNPWLDLYFVLGLPGPRGTVVLSEVAGGCQN